MSFEEEFPSLMDLSNPCMKCGSVQCAFCSEDIQKHCLDKSLVKKTIEDNKKKFKQYKVCVALLEKLENELGFDDE